MQDFLITYYLAPIGRVVIGMCDLITRYPGEFGLLVAGLTSAAAALVLIATFRQER